MNLDHIFKQLKKIEPDADYSRRSKMAIFETPVLEPRLTPWKIFTSSFQIGSSMALMAVLLVLVLGGFSLWKSISPFRLGSLDPVALKAEAEAIDIQIKMTNVSYPQAPKAVVKTEPKEEPKAAVKAEPAPEPAIVKSEPSKDDVASSTETASPESAGAAAITSALDTLSGNTAPKEGTK